MDKNEGAICSGSVDFAGWRSTSSSASASSMSARGSCSRSCPASACARSRSSRRITTRPDHRLAAAGITLRRRTRAQRPLAAEAAQPRAAGSRSSLPAAGQSRRPRHPSCLRRTSAGRRSAPWPRSARAAWAGGCSATTSLLPMSSTMSSPSTTSRRSGPASTRSRSSSCRPATTTTCAGSRRPCARAGAVVGRRAAEGVSRARPHGRRRDPLTPRTTRRRAGRRDARCAGARHAPGAIPRCALVWARSRCMTSEWRRGACGHSCELRGRGSTSGGPRGFARSSGGWPARQAPRVISTSSPRSSGRGSSGSARPTPRAGPAARRPHSSPRGGTGTGARRARQPAVLRAGRPAGRRGREPAALRAPPSYGAARHG